MLLDIRLHIGLLFLAIGAIVAGRGLGPGATAVTGVPIDLIWGCVMAAFGAAMLTLALTSRRPIDGQAAPRQTASRLWPSGSSTKAP
jgi:hypothetical protein